MRCIETASEQDRGFDSLLGFGMKTPSRFFHRFLFFYHFFLLFIFDSFFFSSSGVIIIRSLSARTFLSLREHLFKNPRWVTQIRQENYFNHEKNIIILDQITIINSIIWCWLNHILNIQFAYTNFELNTQMFMCWIRIK